jgi:hypothetical protein
VTLGWLLAGLALGGLVLTRPLAAGGIGVPLMLLLVLTGRGQPLKPLVLRAAIFVLAAAPGVFSAGYVNLALSGSAFLPPLSLWSDVDRIGFGPDVGTRGGHGLANGFGNAWANTAVLLRHLFGWPSYLTLALAMVPFLLVSTNRWDRIFLISAAGSLSKDRGLTSVPLVVVVMAVPMTINVVGYLPKLILAYRDYNGVSRQNLQIVEQAGLQNSVDFVTSHWPNWQAYGSVFPANTPQLDREVIFARDLGEVENWRLMTRYAEHTWWLLRDGQLSKLRR